MKSLTYRRKYCVHRFGLKRIGLPRLTKLLLGLAVFHTTGMPLAAYAQTTLNLPTPIGSLTEITVPSGTTVTSGLIGASTKISGTTQAASGAVVSGNSFTLVSGGVAVGTDVFVSKMIVSAGGTAYDTIVDGGVLYVSSGGQALGTKVTSVTGATVSGTSYTTKSGGTAYIVAGGTATSSTIVAGGKMVVASGGAVLGSGTQSEADYTVVSSGGQMYLSSGGVANDTTLMSGGQIGFSATTGIELNATTVMSGAVLSVGNGVTAAGTIVNSGAQQIVSFGGVASATTINSGGTEIISAGAVVTSAVANSGGTQVVSAGGVAVSTTVNGGGLQSVLNGGVASASLIGSGGTQSIASGGTSIDATVSSGGFQEVASGGTASGTFVMYGATQTVASGGVVSNAQITMVTQANNTAGVAVSAGTQLVTSGGTAIGSVVNGGGAQVVSANGLASATSIGAAGTQTVEAGGIAVAALVNSGGVETVIGHGLASATVVDSGGSQVVSSGGVASTTVVGNGGIQTVSGGGIAVAATINSAGLQSVVSNGVASSTVVNGNAVQNLSSGGSAVDTTVNSGGVQNIYGGGFALDTVLNSGGVQIIDGSSYGVASGTTVGSGAYQDVTSGGSAFDTLVSGGTQQVDGAGSGAAGPGIATSTTVVSGGVLLMNGGTAMNAVVGTGGTIEGVGTIITTPLTIQSGGTLAANSAGTGLTISGGLAFNSGATYAVTVSGASAGEATVVGGPVSIANGAALTLTLASTNFTSGVTYTILTSQLGIIGEFALPSNLPYLAVSEAENVAQATGDTNLTIALTPSNNATGSPGTIHSFTFALPADSVNQNQAAAGMNKVFASSTDIVPMELIESPSYAQAYLSLAQLAGSEAVPFRQIAQERAEQSRDTVSEHVAALNPSVQRGLWVTADYRHAGVDGDSTLGSDGYADNSASLTLGYDRSIAPTVRLGAAVVINNDTVGFSADPANARIDGVQGELYGSWTPLDGSPVYATAIAGIGQWTNRLTRSVTVGSAAPDLNNASFNTSSETLYGEAGVKMSSMIGTLEPYAGAMVGSYAQQGITENGGATALTYAAINTVAASSVLGVRFLRQSTMLLGRALDLQADLAWKHSLTGTNQTLTAALKAAPGDTWQVYGTPSDRNAVKFDVGAGLQVSASARIFAKLGVESGTYMHDFGGSVGAQWKW